LGFFRIIFSDIVPDASHIPNFQQSTSSYLFFPSTIINHHQPSSTQPFRHGSPFRQAAMEKSQQVSEVRQQLDQLIEAEASQRQQLLGRARLQLSGWLEKAEDNEGLEGLEADEAGEAEAEADGG
jgi:hypothetical protein